MFRTILWLAAYLSHVRPSACVRNPADFAVYAFSQSDVDGEDPQVYELKPDVTIRAIGKWSNNGSEPEDYNFAAIARYHANNVTFMGSGTASVIFPHDFATLEIFDDMSTRDADGNIVPHPEFGFPIPARRGNIFNPAYRKYLLDWAKIQIDGSVDGVNFDEVNGGFGGGQTHSFNGNEGFDNYTLADFNRYLLAKYANFTAADWKGKFNMSPDNLPSADDPPDDLARNFNYRTYLGANRWNRNPFNASNPLATEWGRVTPNRLYAEDSSFTATYIRRYWGELVSTLRSYAMQTCNHTLLISSNGLWPFVDFNSVGMYPWNADETTSDGRGADYVPLTSDGRLNGAKSLQSQYRYLKAQNQKIAGEGVPVAVFIDWPNDMMTGYLGISLAEKMDYWRIFGAEAYANGVFPAFHLRETTGLPTAREVGILDFFKNYTAFYRENSGVFRGNEVEDTRVQKSHSGMVATVLVQRGTGMRAVHLVNHNYDNGEMRRITGVAIKDLAVPKCPSRVELVSPDMPQGRGPEVVVWCARGKLQLSEIPVHYYSVLVLVD